MRRYTEGGAGENYFGIHVAAQTKKLASTLPSLVQQEDGSLGDHEPCTKKVASGFPCGSKSKERFGLDTEGRLVMGVHSGNKLNLCV